MSGVRPSSISATVWPLPVAVVLAPYALRSWVPL